MKVEHHEARPTSSALAPTDRFMASAPATARPRSAPSALSARADRPAQILLKVDGILPTLASLAFGCAFVALLALAAVEEWAPELSPGFLAPPPVARKRAADGPLRFRPVVLVSLAWAALYFCFLQGQSASAFWVHQQLREAGAKGGAPAPAWASLKYDRSQQRRGLIFVMERTVGNYVEQSLPFLLGLWMNAAIATPADAAKLGWTWLLLRCCYPLCFAHQLPHRPTGSLSAFAKLGIGVLSLVTWPSYAIVWSLLVGAAKACC